LVLLPNPASRWSFYKMQFCIGPFRKSNLALVLLPNPVFILVALSKFNPHTGRTSGFRLNANFQTHGSINLYQSDLRVTNVIKPTFGSPILSSKPLGYQFYQNQLFSDPRVAFANHGRPRSDLRVKLGCQLAQYQLSIIFFLTRDPFFRESLRELVPFTCNYFLFVEPLFRESMKGLMSL
jgi:hypothetical protein